jgi:dipeptidyl aminopeptidase/acylaminoacyl peptidase
MMLRAVLLSGAIALAPAIAHGGADEARFSARDLLTLKRVSDPQLSSDGRRVAFTLRETDLEGNRVRTSIWTLDIGDSQSRPLRMTQSEGSESSPRWSTQGDLYFLSTRSGSAQVWRLPAAGGESHQVTRYPLEIGTFEVSPRGDRLAMTLEVFPECADLACSAARSAALKAAPTSGQLYDSLFVRHWDAWRDGRFCMLFTVPIGPKYEAGEPENVSRAVRGNVLYRPGGSSDEYEFSPDGSNIVFTARVADRAEAWSVNFDLYRVPADGSAAPVNLTAANGAWDAQPVFLANGDLAYLAMERVGFEADRFRIMVRDARNGATRDIAHGWDRSVRRLRVARDGRSLLANADDVGQTSLFRIDATSGRRTRLVSQGQVSEFAAADGGGAVIAWNSLDSPPDLYAVKASEDGRLRRLTSVNAEVVGQRSLAAFEQFSFPGWNDETVYGYVMRPFGWQQGRQYPIAFLVHGGPQTSFQNHWNWRWNAQVFAARGYGVVMIDFHGSPGYGQSFTDSISKDWGGKPFIDLQKGLEAAIARFPWLDAERACSLGASFGGFMQNWIAGNWPHRFRCLVNHAGTFDMRGMAYTTEELWFQEWEKGGPYFENPQGHEKSNPATLVDRWRTPMLVTHGALDFRVPESQGLATFTALQRRGIDSQFLYFPDENHWVQKPANALQWHDVVFDWLKRYLDEPR